MKKWLPLIALGTAQFVMVLDQSVMNVSISQLAVSYTHLRAHETVLDLVCRLLLEKKKKEALVVSE